MKKTLSLVLALIMMLSFAACSNGGSGSSAGSAASYDGKLADLAAGIYEKQSVELMMGEAMDIDVADKDAVMYYLGLSDAKVLKEAVFTEPMNSSIAYSLVLARLNDDADVEAVKKDIFENIDTRKWICVEADQVRVLSCGNVVMMLMLDSTLEDGLGDNLVKAFESVTGGVTGETLKKG